MFIKYFNFSGINISIQYTEPKVEKYISQLLHPFAIDSRNNCKATGINITITNNNSINIPGSARELSASSSQLKIYQEGYFLYFKYKASIFQINFNNSTGTASLDESIWEIPRLFSHAFLLSAILMLLHSQKCYHLHAAGIVNDENHYILVAPSRSGKSSITTSLVKQGYKFLSDDFLILKENNNRIEASTIPNEFKIDPNSLKHYPDFFNSKYMFTIPENDKTFIKMHDLYPDQVIHISYPNFIIFPKIVSSPKTTIREVSRNEALIMLVKQSPLMFLDHQFSKYNIELLKSLTYQAKLYQLEGGRDLYNRPEIISDILSQIN